MPLPRIGGCFAPPLPSQKLDAYRKLTSDSSTPAPIADAMNKLIAMMDALLEHPPSGLQGQFHPTNLVQIVPLDPHVLAALDPHVPWAHENEMYARLFETLHPASQKDLRDACFHLLWFAVELEKDREPLTADKLTPPKE